MSIKKENKEYITEADVETKFIYNILLSKILEYPSELVHFHVPVKITQGRTTVTKEADVVIENKNSENIINTENIINKSKSEILNFINDSEKNIISSVKQEALSNTKINEKLKDEICDKISVSTRNISSEVNTLDKELKLLLLNSIMEQL